MLWSPTSPPCESDELQWESGGTHEDWNSLFSCGFQDKDRALTWQPRESGQEAPCRWYEKPVSTLLFPLRALHCSYGGRHFLERRRTELQDRAALGPCFLVVWLFLLGAQFTKSENKGRSYFLLLNIQCRTSRSFSCRLRLTGSPDSSSTCVRAAGRSRPPLVHWLSQAGTRSFSHPAP